jgi:hypothetical protein
MSRQLRVLGALFLVWSAVALAEPGATLRLENAPTNRNWYGWKIVTADLVSIAMMAGGIAISHPGGGYLNVLTLGSVGVYAFAPPFVHGLSGAEWWQIGGSFGLRVGLPVLGGAIALLVHPIDNDRDGLTPPLVGAALGAGNSKS